MEKNAQIPFRRHFVQFNSGNIPRIVKHIFANLLMLSLEILLQIDNT